MSATACTVTAQHCLVRRIGARPGALHAAVWVPAPIAGGGAWHTACGEALSDGPRGRIEYWPGEHAHAQLAEHPELVCRRCDRVGDSVTA